MLMLVENSPGLCISQIAYLLNEDISGELEPHNINKNCQQSTFIDSFDRYINPFRAQLSPLNYLTFLPEKQPLLLYNNPF